MSNINILGDISLAEYSLTDDEAAAVAGKISKSLGSSDYCIANLECPIADKTRHKIFKSGPNLKADLKALDFLRSLPVDAYTLANNHIGDYGVEGIRDTKKFLNGLGREYVGTEYYECLAPREYPVLRKELDEKVSFISICENEYGTSRPKMEGACGFEPHRIQMTIEAEKKWADYIIVIFHGGIENYSFPSPLQKQRYRTLVDQGASAVIGMHSHCPVGYETYHGAPIIYGTGNFYFPKKYPVLFQSWNYGYIVHLCLEGRGKIDFHVSPYKTSFDGRDFGLIQEDWMQEYLEGLCKAVQDEQENTQLFYAWVWMRGKSIANYLSVNVENCRLQEFCPVKNIFSCEAHNEVLKTYLDLAYAKKCGQEFYANDSCQEQIGTIKKYISIDQFKKPQMKSGGIKQILWGFGNTAQSKYRQLMASGYDAGELLIVDNDKFKQGIYYCDSRILSPKAAMELYTDAVWNICTPSKYFHEINETLTKNGVPAEHINNIED